MSAQSEQKPSERDMAQNGLVHSQLCRDVPVPLKVPWQEGEQPLTACFGGAVAPLGAIAALRAAPLETP